jgi:hypothetical protein
MLTKGELMFKHYFFSNRSWKAIPGILMLGMVVFLAGWKALDVVAQSAGGSEPGANSGQSGDVTQDRPVPSLPVTAAGPFTPSEPGASASQAGATDPDQRPQGSQQAGAGPSSPSEAGGSIPAIPGAEIASSWPSHWFTVVGATFTPSNSGTNYAYGGSGCVSASSNGQWRANVNLPDGAVIKYVYFNYYNLGNSPATSVWFTSFKYDGTITDLVNINSRPFSTTGTGYYSDLSSEITVPVNNLNYGYAFIWDGPHITDPGSQSPQRLCGVQVGYIPPSVFGLALPIIKK